jgi:hypothetical protein
VADTAVSDTRADSIVLLDAIVIDKCTTTICIGTQVCCPSTGICYDPACLSCCMSWGGGS